MKNSKMKSHIKSRITMAGLVVALLMMAGCGKDKDAGKQGKSATIGDILLADGYEEEDYGDEYNDEDYDEEYYEEYYEKYYSDDNNYEEYEIDVEKVESGLEKIADLNNVGVGDLNVEYDYDGFVTFLSADKCSEIKVTDEESAMDAMVEFCDIIGMSPLNLSFFRKDVSPVSKNVFYTFMQAGYAVIDGEEIPASFGNTLTKIAVDKSGTVVAVSADVYHEEFPDLDESDIISAEEAESLVSDQLEAGQRLYSDATELSFWEDQGTVGDSKMALCWAVYTSSQEEGDSQEYRCPYTVWYVYALGSDLSKNDYPIVEKTGSMTAGYSEESDGNYASDLYFDTLKDGGQYSYTISTKWAKKITPSFTEKSREITVSTLYEESTGLYYLADNDRRIAVTNFYDFENYDTVNSLVTKTPEDPMSWKFQTETEPESGAEYFCDPNYVLGSYAALCQAYDIFSSRYGYNSVDTSGMPILLCVYMSGEEYPSKVSDFTENACNGGQIHDWDIFLTSPTYSGCLEMGTMCHEFTHGVNSQLTQSQYFNSMGAVMEGFADNIGELLAYAAGFKSEKFKWLVGCDNDPIIRSFEDPYEYMCPKYITGRYYMYSIPEALVEVMDCGGVHTNSGVLLYLAYMFSNDAGVDEDALISIDQNIDLWLEALYCTTFYSDYYNVGRYLIYAAENMDFTEKQKEFIKDEVVKYGFTGDFSQVDQMVADEGNYSYDISFTGEDKQYYDFAAEVYLDNLKTTIQTGGLDDNDKLHILADKKKADGIGIYVADPEDYAYSYVCLQALELDGSTEEITFYADETSAGDCFTLEDGYSAVSWGTSFEDEVSMDYDYGDRSFDLTYEGLYLFLLEDDESGEHILYAIRVE